MRPQSNNGGGSRFDRAHPSAPSRLLATATPAKRKEAAKMTPSLAKTAFASAYFRLAPAMATIPGRTDQRADIGSSVKQN
jgi:hypothetical protein